jgi:integrase
MPRHSREDAVSEPVFDDLLEAASTLEGQTGREARFVLVAAGELGLRAGEIAHITENWVDWTEDLIHIPNHDRCDQGRDGGLCGYCRKRARESAKHNDGLTLAEAEARRWEPKTATSARAVPFGHSERASDIIEEFFFHEDGFAHSRAAINRRVDQVLRASRYPEDLTYPHALRATAATKHAYSGLSATALQHLFGWAQLSTANTYIRASGARTKAALEDAHGD